MEDHGEKRGNVAMQLWDTNESGTCIYFSLWCCGFVPMILLNFMFVSSIANQWYCRQDSCSADGYTTSVYTLSISSATFDNHRPWWVHAHYTITVQRQRYQYPLLRYLEECPSSIATTYSSANINQPAIVSLAYCRDEITVDQSISSIEFPPWSGYGRRASRMHKDAHGNIGLCSSCCWNYRPRSWSEVSHGDKSNREMEYRTANIGKRPNSCETGMNLVTHISGFWFIGLLERQLWWNWEIMFF